MKILIIGGGGREHALAWRLRKSPKVSGIIASPGNPGIAQIATCVPAPAELSGFVDLALAHSIDLTVVGPEAPLVAGIVDQFRTRRLKIVGPTQAAARLEGSKIFAKQFFNRAGIPTAKAVQCTNFDEALTALKQFAFPMVIKADGLAAGKGVIIAGNDQEARSAVEKLGPHLVIEEFLEGEEVSFIAITNGSLVLPFVTTQDHKRLLDGDHGPNTGGMGAYSDPRILTSEQTEQVMDRIIQPTLVQLRAESCPFTGFLYAGLIMTTEGPKILEYNVRMGDPEAQVIMHGYTGDLADLLTLVTSGMGGVSRITGGCSVCITIAAQGYPDTSRAGDVISGIAEAEAAGATVFHAGTRQEGDRLVTSGGRVMGVTASGETLRTAIDNAYLAASKIYFDGMHYRKDIGHKGLLRW